MGRLQGVTSSTPHATRRAREVVGLYGDPTSTWAIAAELGLAEPLDLGDVLERATQFITRFPHLGTVPEVDQVASSTWEQVVAQVASTAYEPSSPLVRVILDDDGRRIVVGAHHGVCDGLGLIGLARELTGLDIRSRAVGVGDRTSSRGFVATSLSRLLEALISPPARFNGVGGGVGETVLRVRTPPTGRGTAHLCRAITAAYSAQAGAEDDDRVLVLVGASRRVPGTLAPDRQTAYLRVPLRPGWGVDRVRSTLKGLDPEPAFPETSAVGIGPLVTRLLRNKLGATALVSNLGLLEGDGLEHVAMYPALSGPRSVAWGLASTPSATTLTLRTRGSEFTAEESQALIARVTAGYLDGPQ